MKRFWIGLSTLMVIAVSCTSGPGPIFDATSDTNQTQITLGISMYLLVDDAEEPDPAISTSRDIADLTSILRGVNEIWSQADIRFELRFIGALELPREVLLGLSDGNTAPFFDGLGRRFEVTSPSTVNVFFTPRFGTANGVNPSGTRTAFIIDRPSVHDQRVTSHEIGHMLELHHDLSDSGTLMFSGTNGMALSDQEVVTARYIAVGILAGVR